VNWRIVYFSMLATLGALTLGCRGMGAGATIPYDTAAGYFDRARITYRFDAGREGLPVSAARIEGQLVSYDPLPSAPLPNQTVGTLEIDYPHPRQGEGAAMVTVKLHSRHAPSETGEAASHSGKSQAIKETWQWSISRQELSEVFDALRQTGYFDSQTRTAGEVRISANLDGATVRRDWQHVAALDELMRRTRSHGRLVSYYRSPETVPAYSTAFSAVATFRRLAKRDQTAIARRGGLGGLDASLAGTNGLATPTPDGNGLMARLPAQVQRR